MDTPATPKPAEHAAPGPDPLSSHFYSPGDSDDAPEFIGPFRVVRRLGAGGMGVVYLAERHDGAFKTYVAIKVIRRGHDTDEALRRFAVERHVLGSLNHPNIARIMDAGATPDGRPYFVMEYVEGTPLSKYCDAKKLSIDDRLTLFRTVCLAVQEAHANLVVHRDLKPDNILVTEAGVPKLLDFGIAKVLNPAMAPDEGTPTITALRRLTPEYASPEQVRGEFITPASDVYSLGVILYELLTGRRPFRMSGRIRAEVERIICEEEPERPSAVATRPVDPPQPTTQPGESRSGGEPTPELVSKMRDTQPARLRRKLSGDLDNIVLMAMRKEPSRRYRSALEFARDIDRHLQTLPVEARPTDRWRSASKFVARNRGLVGATAAVAVALAVGLGAALWQAGEANRARDHAVANAERADTEAARRQTLERAVRSDAIDFLLDVNRALRRLPATDDRAALIKRAAEYADLLEKSVDNPDTRFYTELAEVHKELGGISGGGAESNVGDVKSSRLAYEKSVSLGRLALSRTASGDDAQKVAERARGCVFTGLSELSRLHEEAHEFESAKAARHDAIAFAAECARESKEPVWPRRLNGAQMELVDLVVTTGDGAGSAQAYRKITEEWRALPGDSSSESSRRSLAMRLSKTGNALRKTGDPGFGVNELRESVEIRRALREGDPKNTSYPKDVALALADLALSLIESGDAEAAVAAASESVAAIETLVQADPKDARARATSQVAKRALVRSLVAARRLGEACRAGEDLAANAREHVELTPNNPQARDLLLQSLLTAINAETERGDCDKTLALARELQRVAAADATKDGGEKALPLWLGIAERCRARAYLDRDEPAAAAEAAQEAIEILRGDATADATTQRDHPAQIAEVRIILAEALAALGRCETAQTEASASIAWRESNPPVTATDRHEHADAQCRAASAWTCAGDAEQAVAMIERSRALSAAETPERLLTFAQALTMLGRSEEASEALTTASDLLRDEEDCPRTERLRRRIEALGGSRSTAQ